MADIDDLFGKASIDGDYAIATTVKTTRTAGVTVLEAYDLSKFADDTPVFFVTYKKTINPTTGDAVVEDLVSWKALVNVGANTLTNLTVAPGYTDIGNDVGDFIECIPTSYWENSLVNGIQESLNPDGSLKNQAVKDALGITTDPTGGWLAQAYTPNSITANGNGSYDLIFNGVDLTPTISEGMRIRTTRTVAAPNTAFSLDGTNDYYVKTSPNKLTFTDDFTVSAWIYLTAYPTTRAPIVARYNNTNGWAFDVSNAGLVRLIGYNGGSSNVSYVQSVQSVPLNRWVHVSAQLDMSAYTASTTTSYVMIDGIDVPATVARAGTNPTTLVQGGNLNIGTYNDGSSADFFRGYIDQVAIYSAKVTQATILASMHQALTGSETNLASAYSNGSTSDLNTTTPNNLTATNGATTVANAPYGNRGVSTTIDYGIVMKKVFSTNTTLTVQVPEGCTIPTSGGVSSVDYSTQAVPYGFPRDSGRWSIRAEYLSSGTSTSSTTYNNTNGRKFRVPIGAWEVGHATSLLGDTAIADTNRSASVTLSTTTTTETLPMTTGSHHQYKEGSFTTSFNQSVFQELSAATDYYLLCKISASLSTYPNSRGYLYAENAYL